MKEIRLKDRLEEQLIRADLKDGWVFNQVGLEGDDERCWYRMTDPSETQCYYLSRQVGEIFWDFLPTGDEKRVMTEDEYMEWVRNCPF